MSAQARATPEEKSLEREIRTSGMILSEGRTMEMFLRELIEKELYLKDRVEARTFGEKEASNLKLFLNNFATKPEFRQRVEQLGIIRDAESHGALIAFESVAGAIRAFNRENPSFALPVPDQLAVMTPPGERPQVGVFVLPDCKRPGMLETLCLDAIEEWERNASAKLLPCVNEFFICLGNQGKTPVNRPKAQFAAYALAADVIDPQLGRAAQMGAIPWKTRTFDPLKAFIRSIAGQP
jgi:hypothetical protein